MRSELQEHFEALNPTWKAEAFGVAPDGDVFLTDEQVCNFQVPACRKCGGILKPDVTFFGDTVSQEKVSFVHQRLAESDSMLVAGSSMQVSRSASQTAFLLLCYSACNDPWSHHFRTTNGLWIRSTFAELLCILFLLWLESGFTGDLFGLPCHSVASLLHAAVNNSIQTSLCCLLYQVTIVHEGKIPDTIHSSHFFCLKFLAFGSFLGLMAHCVEYQTLGPLIPY